MRSTTALFLVLLHLVTQGDHAVVFGQDVAVRLTPQASQVDASFRGLAVRNKTEAWVTGSKGTVIRTVDAGQTWKRIKVAGAEKLDFRDVEVLPDGTVVLMSVGHGDASRILRSTDAGSSWKTVLVNAEPDGFFDGIAFNADGKTGALFGDPIDGRLDFYQTHDGGQTWKRLPTEQRPELKQGEYGFAASGTSIFVRGRNAWIATGGSVARVLHSADDGATWAARETPLRSGNESSGIFSIDFMDAKTAVVIGGDYARPESDRDNVAQSVDGGTTWLAVDVRMPHKACVRSLGKRRLITCGRTGVAYSTDAGGTWTPITSVGYFTLAVDRASGTGFLAGKDGRVARFELAEPSDK